MAVQMIFTSAELPTGYSWLLFGLIKLAGFYAHALT